MKKTNCVSLAMAAVILSATVLPVQVAHASRSDQEKLSYFTDKVKGYQSDAKDLNLVMGIFTVALGGGVIAWGATDSNYANSRGVLIGVGAATVGLGIWGLMTRSQLQTQFDSLDGVLKGSESSAYKVGALETYYKTSAEWMESGRIVNSVAFAGLGAGLLIGGAASGNTAFAGNTNAMWIGGAFILSGVLSYFMKSPSEKEWDSYKEFLNGAAPKKADSFTPDPQFFVTTVPSGAGVGMGGGVQISL